MPFEVNTGTSADPLDGTEKLPVSQGGEPRVISAVQFAYRNADGDYIADGPLQAQSLRLVPEGSNATTALYDLSGMDGSTQDFMVLREGVTVIVDQNDGDPSDNYVWYHGYNMGENGARQDTSKAGFSERKERSYLLNGVGPFGFEWHIQLDTIAGVLIRPLSIFAPYDGDGVGLSSQVDYVSFEQNGGSRQVYFDLAGGFTEYSDGMALRFAGNADTVLQQINAAGNAYLDLPLINARNEQEERQAVYHVADPITNVFAVSAHVTRNLTNPVNGGFGEYMIAGNVTGDYTMTFRQVSVSGALLDQLVNTHATGRIVRSLITVGGDCMEVFQVGAAFAGFGHHASSGELRFGFYNDLTNNLALTLAPSAGGYLATFSGPAKLKSFTVATLPSASTTGAGSMIYVSDETGGGVIAFSDGTDWRRMTDRAVVS